MNENAQKVKAYQKSTGRKGTQMAVELRVKSMTYNSWMHSGNTARECPEYAVRIVELMQERDSLLQRISLLEEKLE